MSENKCLCCSAVAGTFLNIFDTRCRVKDAAVISLAKILENIMLIKLPHTIRNRTAKVCIKCSSKLIEFYDFRNMCLKSVNSANVVENITVKTVAENMVETKIEKEEPDIEPELIPETTTELDVLNDSIEPKFEPKDEEIYVDELDASAPPKKKRKFGTEDFAVKLEGIFTCYVCDQVFNTYADCRSHFENHVFENTARTVKRLCMLCNTTPQECYIKHIKKLHPEHRPNICKCGQTYQLIHHLQAHLRMHAQGETVACQGCQLHFANKLQLRTHLCHTRHSYTDFHCPYCGLGFETFAEVLQHVPQHESEHKLKIKYFPCFACRNIYLKRKFFENHFCSLQHPAIVDEATRAAANLEDIEFVQTSISGPYQCDGCPSSFDNEDELLCHQYSLCTKPKKLMCYICNIEFNNAGTLSVHKKTHNDTVGVREASTFVCFHCGRQFKNKGALTAHEIIHRTERSWQCEFCPNSFKDKRGLKTHLVSHQPKQLECYLCGKFYRSRQSIRLHMKDVHIRPDKGYKCQTCDKIFVLEVDRNRHAKQHRFKNVSCEICGRAFNSILSLRLHHDVVHEKLRFDCYVCREVIPSRTQLNAHLFWHRGFKPEKCILCEKSYLSRERLKRHVRRHHPHVTFNRKLFNYTEANENIPHILGACAVRNGARLTEEQVSTLMKILPLKNVRIE